MIKNATQRVFQPLLIALCAGSLFLAACMSSGHGNGGDGSSRTPAAQRGGAELWTANCAYCHHIRSPSVYSDAEWDVVVMHMRVRANLTAAEHDKILEFLKAGN